MLSAEHQQMESGEYRGLQSPFDIGAMDGMETHEMPHESLATTVPRKRVALDVDPKTNKIMSRITIRNRSSEIIAFKNECSIDDGYSMEPDRGILEPGLNVQVQLVMDETVTPSRDIEQDNCTIFVAPYSSAQYPDLEEFLDNQFHNHEKIEKHPMLPAMSSEAKERLLKAADAEAEAKKKDDEVKHMKQIVYPAIGAVVGLVSFYVIFHDWCQTCLGDMATDRR